MFKKQDQQPAEDANPTRGQNAKRFGKYGLILGAVLGLATGGIFGIARSALLFGGVGLLAGATAGNKLNPLVDKLTGFIPKLREKFQSPEAGITPEQVVAPQVDAGVATTKGLDSLDPSLLADVRGQVNDAVAKGRAGAEAINTAAVEAVTVPGAPNGWVDAVSKKQPTHPAHMTPQ